MVFYHLMQFGGVEISRSSISYIPRISHELYHISDIKSHSENLPEWPINLFVAFIVVISVHLSRFAVTIPDFPNFASYRVSPAVADEKNLYHRLLLLFSLFMVVCFIPFNPA